MVWHPNSNADVLLRLRAERPSKLTTDAANEIERLKAALVKYGAHTGMCGYEGRPENEPTGYRCVCGLYDIVDAEAHLAALD